ncbi:hypothetical protein M501DRAFT_941205 [Patellaria atrata CBS 101060]|uniref:Rhodopsin domain-containing protein n=1 Tax=Patellaria atrata CBS 101060 TaxID=1346257 RepID=A0A9P4S436_9PEZI|nr:hypothetical protein M501DRAFT_941205 [Patellaria atrata CBS 101060]
MTLTRGEAALATSIVFTVIALVTVILRLFTRFFLIKNHGPEDWCIIPAIVTSVAFTCLIGEQVKYGMGKHIADIPIEDSARSLKPFWATLWLYNISLSTTKLSIILQYMRVFTTPKMRISCIIAMVALGIVSLWTFFSSIFICYPIAYFWDSTIDGKCMNKFAVWYANASLQLFFDVLLIALPMPVIQRLKLGKKQKYALMFVFGLGGFVCLVGILRFENLTRIEKSFDPTYDNAPGAMWSAIEDNVGIICACLPAMRPLLSKIMPTFFPGSSAERSNNYMTGTHKGSGHMRSTRNKSKSGMGLTTNVDTVFEMVTSKEALSRKNSKMEVKDEEDDRHIKVVTVLDQSYELEPARVTDIEVDGRSRDVESLDDASDKDLVWDRRHRGAS